MTTIFHWRLSILVVASFLSPAVTFLVPPTEGSFIRLYCAFSLEDSTRQTEICRNFTIEQVSNRRRALDVFVFRQWSVSAADYQQTWLDQHDEALTEQEAVERLTPGIDDNGRDTTILGGPIVSFVALVSDEHFDRTHGVAATVDAKLEEQHVYLKNLLVDERARRRGVASALVAAVKVFTETTPADEVVLHVERHNGNAIAFYEKEGFEFAEENEGDGRMTCQVRTVSTQNLAQ